METQNMSIFITERGC